MPHSSRSPVALVSRLATLLVAGSLLFGLAPGALVAAPGVTAVEVQAGLAYPWDVAFTPNGEMLVTERPGRVRIYASSAPAASLLSTAEITVRAEGEAGLMGIAVDRDFATNRFVYVCASRQVGTEWLNEVLRYRLETDFALSFEAVVLSGMQAGNIHNGCALEMGPDGKLWITMGESGNPWLAQDPTSLNGKVLRMNPDGTVPADNPVLAGASAPSPVYSMGHRNPQGIAFRPGTGEAYLTEHGPELDDEVNILVAGGNYGWPCYTGSGTPYLAGSCGAATDYLSPAWASGTPTLATSGATFASGAGWGELDGQLLVSTLKQQDLRSFAPAPSGTVSQSGVYLDGQYGRLRAAVAGPGTSVFATTSGGTNDRVVAISPGPEATPTPAPSGPTVVTLAADADAYVDSGSAGANFGGAGRLKVRGATTGRQMSTYLRFVVSGVGTVTDARLRLYANDGSPNAGAVFATAAAWDERTLTWTSRPAASGTQIDALAAVTQATWIELDMSTAIRGDGTYAFVITNGSSDTASFHSREAINAPQLVLTTAGTATTPSPTSTASATPTSAATPTPTPAPPVAPIAFAPAADAHVDSGKGSANFGGASRLKIRSGSRAFDSYLRFNVSGAGPIASGVLRIWVADASPNGGAIHATATSWTETGLTWNNRPPPSGAPIDLLGPVSAGSWVELDVSAALIGDGSYGFVIVGGSSDPASLHSREAPKPPQLVVTPAGPSPTPTPTASPTPTPTPTPTMTPVATPSPTPTGSPTEPPPGDPAIPGYGTATVGGSGGRVIEVTTLADSGPGSLREALTATGPRIVRFTVAGVIGLSSRVDVLEPFLTLDGSTAPGPVVVRGGQIRIRTHEVIVRHLRLRLGDEVALPADEEPLTLSGLREEVYNVVVDHMSLVWGPDIGGLAILGNVHDVTVMDSIMGEGLYRSRHPESQEGDGHSHALNITQVNATGLHPRRITVVNNLLTTSNERMPQLQGAECVDIVNNVIYNWGHTSAEGNPRSVNLVGNLFRSGPLSVTDLIWRPDTSNVAPSLYPGSVHAADNVADGFSPVLGAAPGVYVESPPCPLSVVPASAASAYDRAAAGAGATLPQRDVVDDRIVSQLTERTGAFFNGAAEASPNPYWP